MALRAREGKPRRVAVIGGGPAGVIATRFLVDVGHSAEVFEAGTEVGGIWAPEPTNKVVYDGLVTNIPTVAMQSFDVDFPAGMPSYVRARDLGDYIVSYAERFDLRRLVQFASRVTRVRPVATEEQEEAGESAWEVDWSDAQHKVHTKTFDAVVVATGHYEEPYCPEIPGEAEWLSGGSAGSRSIHHARSYSVPSEHAGKSVMVVGGRSSAVDIARELRGVASWVYVLEKGCQEVLQEGPCTHVPLGTSLSADGQLRLSGGDVVPGPPVEVLILATGYQYHFPFLDEAELRLDMGPARRYVAPLWQHVIHARRPSLCFMGIPLSVPTPIQLFESQARFVASELLTRASTRAEREQWVAARFAAVGERSQDLHFLSNDTWEHLLELTKRSGLLSEAELEEYRRKLDVVVAVYQDRVSKKPKYPWSDDWYRRCEYTVDWEKGSWQVQLPPNAAL